MKILTKKKQKEILQRISVCQIVATDHVTDIVAYDRIMENLIYLSLIVGGDDGANKALDSVWNHRQAKKESELEKRFEEMVGKNV